MSTSLVSPEFVKQTTIVSIGIQILTGLFGFQGLTIDVPREHQILKQALVVEVIVQMIELVFYISFIVKFNLETLAATRYFDWAITTPTMLFTTMAFFVYQKNKENGNDTSFTLKEFWNSHRRDILLVVLSNFLMLLLGYLGEVGVLDRHIALGTSFVFFFFTFYLIYTKYAHGSKYTSNMFWLLFVIWFIYGVVYMFPTEEKNISFNFLDIIAKNFFGLFLAYKINMVE